MSDSGGSNARLILLAVVIVALPCAYFGAHVYRSYRHRWASDRMETAITRLALDCPSDLTDDQWAYCIGWTWNLHCNYGVHPSFIPTAELQRIVEEFETKIDAGPNLATIDWLWDEYYRAAPRAHDYERFRPTSPANRPQFLAGAGVDTPLSEWRSEYERRTGEK